MSRKQESGQVFVLAALSMMVLIGISAFCVNASYMFYQHQRMQAQVDEQTRLAAGNGCTAATTNLDNGVLVIAPVSVGGFFGQDGSYCNGVLTKSPGGLFGSILRFPNKISVHAVAEHGGSTEHYFSLLGLCRTTDAGANPCGNPSCAVNFQDGSLVATIDGDVYSDSSDSYTSCKNVNATVTWEGTPPFSYTSNANLVDPFAYSFPTSGNNTLRHCKSAGSGTVSYSSSDCSTALDKTCLTGMSIPAQADDYFQAESATAELNSLGNNSNTEVYLPYCSGSNKVPTVYLVDGSSGDSKGITDNSTSSTYVVSSTVAFQSGVKVTSSGAFTVTSPATGPFAGYALYQEHTNPCSSYNNAQFSGTPISVVGLFDMSCSNVTFSGGGAYSFQGSVIGYTITFAGSSSGTAVFTPPPVPPARGAFLVQ